MRVKFLKNVAFLVLAATMGMTSAQSAIGEIERNEQALKGTWLFQISIQDCNSGVPLGQPFESLLTFANGGTLTKTTANPTFYPAVRSPGHGVWKTSGHHTYQATSTAFVTLNGVLARTQTISQTIEVLTEDTLRTTDASVTFYKPDGTLLASGCAAATGTRIEMPN